ncbi:hypothetical protein [Halopelagius longus]|uniref:Uncharacterized protein n=1 Tax=Halopelagius longus TaxID=1236180 RepID=A0A1H0Z9Q6_9EURY|nr:hypothetical protein [Halopelagius longus]RDI72898.1 hypothetical protein DWB78_14850 [Halopelagius longus]SDQ24128.1 hypothetical protein SAMN05216278_1096 [Halopelagius longus]
MATTGERLAEVPTAAADWAAGIAGVLEENLPRVAVFVFACAGVGFGPFGAGLLTVLLAVVLPAAGVGGFLLAKEKVPSLLREKLGSSEPRRFDERSESVVEGRTAGE